MARTRGLSLAYGLRNLKARRLTTLLTAGGMALVVFVFASVLMMSEGLKQTLSGTGSAENLLLLRQGAQTEVQSTLTRDQVNLVRALPGVRTDARGQPLMSAEALVLINVPRRDGEGLANLVVRGTSAVGLTLRPQVALRSGRLFRPGVSEVVVGSALTRGRLAIQVGDTVRFGQREWRVVGVFDAGASGFDAEIWADREQVMQAFRRDSYSSLVVGLRDPATEPIFRAGVAAQPLLKVDVQRESDFYAAQSQSLSQFITLLGNTITVIFSIGAVIGAMITMSASVANRTREIGTLRALGFQRTNIVITFLQEALLLGALAGVMGLIAAAFMQQIEISTTNIQTFSEVVFRLVLTPGVAVQVFAFSLLMGVLGGVLPALRAARLEIVDALRTG